MNRLPVVILLLSLYLSSCGPIPGIQDPYYVDIGRQKENLLYVPSSINTPLSAKKGHADINLVHTSGAKYEGLEIQGAYLPSNRMGIIASYSGGGNNILLDYTEFNRFEVGVGYITPLKHGWHFETYAGTGKGKINNHHHTGYSNLKLNHYFIQPAFAYKNEKKTVEIGLISRFAGVRFSVMDKVFDADREKFTSEQIQSLHDNPFHIMWEPGIIARAGWKNFKFHGGYTASADLTENMINKANGNLSLGISVQFNTSKK